jgi:hypothetical protein
VSAGAPPRRGAARRGAARARAPTDRALLLLSLRELLRADGLERGQLALEALALRRLRGLAAPLALALLAPVAQHELARVAELLGLVRVERRRGARATAAANANAAAAAVVLVVLVRRARRQLLRVRVRARAAAARLLLPREAWRAQARGRGLRRAAVVAAEVHQTPTTRRCFGGER